MPIQYAAGAANASTTLTAIPELVFPSNALWKVKVENITVVGQRVTMCLSAKKIDTAATGYVLYQTDTATTPEWDGNFFRAASIQSTNAGFAASGISTGAACTVASSL